MEAIDTFQWYTFSMARPDTVSRDVTRQIRREIINGTFMPGSRLPPRVELEERYRVSVTTMQGIMDRLRREGFIVAKGVRGTFVAPHPPHLFRIACVFPFDESGFGSTPYWTGLANIAKAHEPEDLFEFDAVFDAVPSRNTPQWQRLEQDLNADRLAGVIIASNPRTYSGTRLVDDPRLARVFLAPWGENNYRPSVTHDHRAMAKIMAETLVKQKCKRPAIITYAKLSNNVILDEIHAALAEVGIQPDPAFLQAITPQDDQVLGHLAMLFARSRPRPDAYIITDDTLVSGFTRGLVDAGIDQSDKLCVLAYANFPNATVSHVPAVRVGFDIQEIFDRALELLKTQCHSQAGHRRGEKQRLIIKPHVVW